ncbi:MAG: hypothetical protein ACPGR2_00565 [Psychrobium sp.]
MKKWEYASLTLVWSGKGKGVTVTQFGHSKHYALSSDKKIFSNNHINRFNQIIGKLGAAGWELVSISTLHGSSYNYSFLADSGNHSTEAQAQEFWFKREVSDEKLSTIEQTLMYVFKEHKVSTQKSDEHFDYWNS